MIDVAGAETRITTHGPIDTAKNGERAYRARSQSVAVLFDVDHDQVVGREERPRAGDLDCRVDESEWSRVEPVLAP